MVARHIVDRLSRSSFPTTDYVPSIFHGPSFPPLVTLTLGRLLDLQCRRYGSQECLIVPWTGARWTYDYLSEQSISLAKMFVDVGICPGDRIGIMAGNCEQYVSTVFAAARAGAILVVLNNTYTADEATRALQHTGCKILLTTFKIGNVDNSPLITKLCREPNCAPWLEEIIILREEAQDFRTYEEAVQTGASLPNQHLEDIQNDVGAHDVCVLLFTSGSTGLPKAASLTHQYVLKWY
jgi:acyl-coenzyme A synthetase/AMP-(fatty) acid ligase